MLKLVLMICAFVLWLPLPAAAADCGRDSPCLYLFPDNPRFDSRRGYHKEPRNRYRHYGNDRGYYYGYPVMVIPRGRYLNDYAPTPDGDPYGPYRMDGPPVYYGPPYYAR